MLKAIKIRLYPNKSQSEYINRLCGCYRKVYNLCLEYKINAYTEDKTSLGLKELGNYYHQELTKSEDLDYINEHNTKVLKQAIINLLDAYKNFFINKTGFPKYKSKHDRTQTARFPLEAISKKNMYSNNKITLTSQLKNISFECSERNKNYLTKHKDKIHSATISVSKTGKYFLSILIDNYIIEQPKPINDIIGLDVGVKNFVMTSTGQAFKNLKLNRHNKRKLKKLQRQLSRKQLIGTGLFRINKYGKEVEIKVPSKNRKKARLKLAKVYEKIENQKIDYIHNITSQLIRENQTIVVEDLNINGMLKNHKLAGSISEVSLGEFFRQLKYKAEWYGRDLIIIDRWFPSSKLCHCCGYKYKELSLDEREWICPHCGVHHDRDLNASINILNEGLRLLNKELNKQIGIRYPESTLVDSPLMDDRLSNEALKSYDRLKQETKTNELRSKT